VTLVTKYLSMTLGTNRRFQHCLRRAWEFLASFPGRSPALAAVIISRRRGLLTRQPIFAGYIVLIPQYVGRITVEPEYAGEVALAE
jgi:hypothetical protein